MNGTEKRTDERKKIHPLKLKLRQILKRHVQNRGKRENCTVGEEY